jgi:hypothetical protein
MILGQFVLGQELLESLFYSGTWRNSYTFTYVAGATVFITPALTSLIPEGTFIHIYAGAADDDLTLCPNGESTSIDFSEISGGSAQIYMEIVMETTKEKIVPSISALSILIQQAASLQTVARQILDDALTGTNAEYWIDSELQKYIVPYSWFKAIKHRKALAKVAEACGGKVYQSRDGTIRIEAGNYISRKAEDAVVDTINNDRIYDAKSPVSEVKNRIRITTKPYAPQTLTKVWELSGNKIINNGEYRTFDITYSDYDAVIDGVVVLSSSPAGATVYSQTHYANGAHVVILGNADNQTLTMSINAKPLVIVGGVTVERSDGASIRRNGYVDLAIDDNDLIQSEEVAGMIADDLLASMKDETRSGEIEWRGDPSFEICDPVTVKGFDKVVFISQEFNFNGVLRVSSSIRKV